MIFYLTYSEAPSGIFSSQVIDVIAFLNANLNANVKLVSFVSIRNYFKYRETIKQQLPGSIILPMYPKIINWKKNRLLLSLVCRLHKPETIIARNILAGHLAIMMKDKSRCAKVVYDGRGAIAAEWKEYNVINNDELVKQSPLLEKEAILNSDFRMAVSNALINHWNTAFGYAGNNHVVIPCTLNSVFQNSVFSPQAIAHARQQLMLHANDVVFVYSGSTAGWQSFDLLKKIIIPVLSQSVSNKLVFFSKSDQNITELAALFPDQVSCKFVAPNEVPALLMAGDYGLLIREHSITNQVASPLKYAEYLACGLKVIISDNLGDYSALTVKHNWGFLSTNVSSHDKPTYEQKQRLRTEALNFFVKENYYSQYHKMLEYI